uniref:Uncharacterized protein n=1 Tax=Helianthus annuus TaxID=4232 RepID=A0A251URH7_HELAN
MFTFMIFGCKIHDASDPFHSAPTFRLLTEQTKVVRFVIWTCYLGVLEWSWVETLGYMLVDYENLF